MSTAGELLPGVLRDVADLLDRVTPEDLAKPTPCADLDVGGLRRHVLGWSGFFAAALDDPDGTGTRPDPQKPDEPDDPAAAAAAVRASADGVARAVGGGVADRPVKVVQATMPGTMLLSMAVWEYVVHGHDLAVAVGAPWEPSPEAVELAERFAPTMLTDAYRGPGRDFGHPVVVPADAPPLDRLLGFSGRDPRWAPPA